MTVAGKLELTIKINDFPTNVETVDNGWKRFEVDCEGRIASITVKPSLEDGSNNNVRSLILVSCGAFKSQIVGCVRFTYFPFYIRLYRLTHPTR
jgi:hypothetical protein